MLVNKGPICGQFMDRPIHAFLDYAGGERIYFDRVACMDAAGMISLASLSEGEYLVSPGLIYRAMETSGKTNNSVDNP